MKNIIKCIFTAIICLLGYSCDINGGNTEVKTDDRCGIKAAKYIKLWCEDDLAVIQILSNKGMGEDWTWYGKTYNNAVLAKLDTTLAKSSEDWSKDSDSLFYFNYVLPQIDYGLTCKVCCPPTINILITSLASHPCASGK